MWTATGRLAAVVVALSAAVAGAAEGPAGPTAAELDTLLAQGNYAAVVAGASRLLSANGSAAAGVDKARVYAIRGEAQLRLAEYPQAADAFTRAAKAATDPRAAAVDSATVLLLKRSRAGAYAPKQLAGDGTRPSPVQIADPGDRRTAMSYLFADEFAAATPRLKSYRAAKSVPQLLAGVQFAAGLRQLEQVATGSADKSGPEVAAISEQAHGLVAAELQQLEQRVDQIKGAAESRGSSPGARAHPGQPTAGGGGNEPSDDTGGGGGGEPPRGRKAGLTRQAAAELKQIQVACQQQIGPAADAFAKATADAPAGDGATAPADDSGGGATTAPAGGGSPWQAVSSEAADTATKAQRVLSDDSGRTGGAHGPGTGTPRQPR